MFFKKYKNEYFFLLKTVFLIICIFSQQKVCAIENSIGNEKVASQALSASFYDIAILNIDKLLHESKAAKGIQTDLEEHRLKFQDEMKKHEENFIAFEKALVEQQKNLRPEEFAIKRKEFDAQVAEVHQKATERREQIENAFSQAMEKIQETILLLVRDMAVKNKYKLVVPRNFIIYQEEGLEITEEILKELDQKLPSVQLNFF